MNLSFPVGIDEKADTGYGKTFLAYGLESYHGMFFVDHEGLVRPCSHGEQSKITVDDKEFTISHMEAKVIDLLKKSGVENVEPQVLPDDIFDIKTHNEVLAEWRSLRADAPKEASVHGQITFSGVPVGGSDNQTAAHDDDHVVEHRPRFHAVSRSCRNYHGANKSRRHLPDQEPDQRRIQIHLFRRRHEKPGPHDPHRSRPSEGERRRGLN
jgi:hypothetical protein